MKVDLTGKIRETQLSPAKALLPMFEAVVNSLQAIEDARSLKRLEPPKIEIVVNREAMLEGHEGDGEVIGFVISDNGVGFSSTNLNSFFTEYTMYKASRGGKGVGRFHWLKAFQFAEVESHFWEGDKLLRQAFKFTVSGEEPAHPASDSSERAPHTTVQLVGMRSPLSSSTTETSMHTINKIINRGLWITVPPAMAILFGFATNSALKSDGIYIGHPRERVVYINAPQDPRLTQLANAIDVRQLRSR